MSSISDCAIFLDRDGVIIEDSHLLTDVAKIRPIDGIKRFVYQLHELGFKFFVVTNQTVVSRGLLSLEETIELNELVLEKASIKSFIDEVYLCPHHPNATVEEYREDCLCRKPKPGMLLQAQQKYGVDLSKSFMIGDRVSDIIAGNSAGCTTILLKSGMHDQTMIETTVTVVDEMKKEDFVATSLEQCLTYILQQTQG